MTAGRGEDTQRVMPSLPGVRRGGRPKGGKNRFNWNAVRQMEEAGFDPIEEMIGLYVLLKDDIEKIKEEKGSITYTGSSLVTSARQILETLASYGYLKRRPDIEQEENIDPLKIELVIVNNDPDKKVNLL